MKNCNCKKLTEFLDEEVGFFNAPFSRDFQKSLWTVTAIADKKRARFYFLENHV